MSSLTIFLLALSCVFVSVVIVLVYRTFRPYRDPESELVQRAMQRGRWQGLGLWIMLAGAIIAFHYKGTRDAEWSGLVIIGSLFLSSIVGYLQLWYFRRHPLTPKDSPSTTST
jgi:hypothetical protein